MGDPIKTATAAIMRYVGGVIPHRYYEAVQSLVAETVANAVAAATAIIAEAYARELRADDEKLKEINERLAVIHTGVDKLIADKKHLEERVVFMDKENALLRGRLQLLKSMYNIPDSPGGVL